MLQWNIYEISSQTHKLHGVKCRGRIRKFANQLQINLLTENASDIENVVRFALLIDQDPSQIIDFVRSIFYDVEVTLAETNILNPVLSKLKINKDDRYEI